MKKILQKLGKWLAYLASKVSGQSYTIGPDPLVPLPGLNSTTARPQILCCQQQVPFQDFRFLIMGHDEIDTMIKRKIVDNLIDTIVKSKMIEWHVYDDNINQLRCYQATLKLLISNC